MNEDNLVQRSRLRSKIAFKDLFDTIFETTTYTIKLIHFFQNSVSQILQERRPIESFYPPLVRPKIWFEFLA